MPLMLMDHAKDPKDEVRERVGSVEGFVVTGSQVLVGIYKRPDKTRGGILLAQQTRDEDKFQGKVGLILAKGPDAFVEDDKYRFAVKAEVGDWVVFKVSDGWPFRINSDEGDCRMLVDVDVRAVVDQPDRVF